jgi:hypothetical protein
MGLPSGGRPVRGGIREYPTKVGLRFLIEYW